MLVIKDGKYPVHIKQSFSGKYPYHKVLDRKHSGRQRDLKALRSQKRYQMLPADWRIVFNSYFFIHYLNYKMRIESTQSRTVRDLCVSGI